ncbi:MAG: class I SAM-dependent methyltransferase [Chloroflexota bacterium]|nr:MAG: class I SAM-dependent methyltransferase [Chloroflexota bacterium]
MAKSPDILKPLLFRAKQWFRQLSGSYTPISWEKPFETLRVKWIEIPGGDARIRADELLTLSDDEFLRFWSGGRQAYTKGDAFAIRGWYNILYASALQGKRVLDVGCGLGFDSIYFAQHGATVTFLDIVEVNVQVIKRLCKILEIPSARFFYMKDIESLYSLDQDFDVILCLGSLINAPFEVARREAQELLKHLKIGGRWIELAYPKKRWVREGRLPFSVWGEFTDGPGTPWMEWYDLPKLLRRLEPAKFDVVLYHEFHNGDFNWFDLLRRE